jgi:hypothetical protein
MAGNYEPVSMAVVSCADDAESLSPILSDKKCTLTSPSSFPSDPPTAGNLPDDTDGSSFTSDTSSSILDEEVRILVKKMKRQEKEGITP